MQQKDFSQLAISNADKSKTVQTRPVQPHNRKDFCFTPFLLPKKSWNLRTFKKNEWGRLKVWFFTPTTKCVAETQIDTLLHLLPLHKKWLEVVCFPMLLDRLRNIFSDFQVRMSCEVLLAYLTKCLLELLDDLSALHYFRILVMYLERMMAYLTDCQLHDLQVLAWKSWLNVTTYTWTCDLGHQVRMNSLYTSFTEWLIGTPWLELRCRPVQLLFFASAAWRLRFTCCARQKRKKWLLAACLT